MVNILLETLKSLPGDMLLKDVLVELDRLKSSVTHDICLEQHRNYYDRNKDEINRRRREKRAMKKI